MLVRFMPELGKYAMNSLTVMLLFLLVFVSTVTKDILEAKKLLKRYEAFWIYPFLSVVLLIGFALNTDIILDLFIMLELAACVNLWILEYRRYKKARNGMESCTLYIPILPDNTVIVENPMMDGEMKVLGFMFYNTRTMEYETYGTVSDETLANVRDNDPELYKKIMDNEPVNAQDCPLSCVWESNIPNEHDELLQYIIVECISLYSQQLVEFCKYLSEDSIIIFRLCGKRNNEVSISCDKYFSDETMTKFIDKVDEEYRKMRENS
ncbi:MAG: hypothetical protein SPL82_15680 [Lachnospiraceae bacterium]|nr:hypothetical protein [Lachnospiraceae bacterium]